MDQDDPILGVASNPHPDAHAVSHHAAHSGASTHTGPDGSPDAPTCAHTCANTCANAGPNTRANTRAHADPCSHTPSPGRDGTTRLRYTDRAGARNLINKKYPPGVGAPDGNERGNQIETSDCPFIIL